MPSKGVAKWQVTVAVAVASPTTAEHAQAHSHTHTHTESLRAELLLTTFGVSSSAESQHRHHHHHPTASTAAFAWRTTSRIDSVHFTLSSPRWCSASIPTKLIPSPGYRLLICTEENQRRSWLRKAVRSSRLVRQQLRPPSSRWHRRHRSLRTLRPSNQRPAPDRCHRLAFLAFKNVPSCRI